MSDVLNKILETLTEEQKKQLANDLLGSLTKEEEAVSQGSVNEDFTVNRQEEPKNRKTPVRFKKNQWTDEGEDKDLQTDYSKLERTPRKRKAPNKKTVECHVCGKSFSMNSNLVYGEFQRCNRCTR